ncbi:MAG: hypothetical protein LBW77_04880 [Verrucomicrobiota bacterium]|jgi:hypothetical protein|nr:hypothetical protein [Verrucomicrobiota bacterium]
MQRKLMFTREARENLDALESDPQKAGLLRQVRKTLALMETNLRHPSLATHKYVSLSRSGRDVFESYVQNKTLGAYRVFWPYGPDEDIGERRISVITIVAVTPHP